MVIFSSPRNEIKAEAAEEEYSEFSDKHRLIQSQSQGSVVSALFNFRNKDPSYATEKAAAYVVTIYCKCLYFACFNVFLW